MLQYVALACCGRSDGAEGLKNETARPVKFKENFARAMAFEESVAPLISF